MSDEPKEILTIPEVAEYLQMSPSKVYSLVARGEIPHLKIGRNVRIRQSDLNHWLETTRMERAIQMAEGWVQKALDEMNMDSEELRGARRKNHGKSSR